jgi:hypothetical protein
VGWIAEDQGAPGMVGGSCQQPRIVRLAAHHPVQDHQVGRCHRPGVGGEVVEAPVQAPLNAGLFGQRARLVLVSGGEFQVLGPARARLRQFDLDLADVPPTSSTVVPSMPRSRRNSTTVWAVLSRPRLLYLLASLWANRWLKRRRQSREGQQLAIQGSVAARRRV